MITKAATQKLLANRWPMFPICVPSYKRLDRKDNKTLTGIIERCGPEVQRNTYVFVRAEQEQAYRDNYSTVNIVRLPHVEGLAGTRQYIQDFVTRELRKPYFVDMDDDITGLKHVYYEGGEDHLSKADETDNEQILRLGCALARMAFETDNCLLGNFHRVRFASTYPASQTAYVVNKGSTPRQVTFVNGAGLTLRNVKRNLEFDITGDDVGFVAEICKARGDFFQIPCLAYAFVDDAVNSVIRNDGNRRRLAEEEYALLRKYEMGREYLRISQTYEDGGYKFSDIDYRRYREVAGRPEKKVTLDEFRAWAKQKAGGYKGEDKRKKNEH